MTSEDMPWNKPSGAVQGQIQPMGGQPMSVCLRLWLNSNFLGSQCHYRATKSALLLVERKGRGQPPRLSRRVVPYALVFRASPRTQVR